MHAWYEATVPIWYALFPMWYLFIKELRNREWGQAGLTFILICVCVVACK